MATQQAVKGSTITYEQSMVLIKNMVRISISSICYMRELFPSDCFTKKSYGAAEIHQLQGAKENNGEISITHEKAFLLTQWLEHGVFEALQEEYLNTMTFSIYCTHPITDKDLLLETYEFKVAYQKGTTPAKINNVELNSKDAVKAQAIKFIRQLTQFTQTLDQLPADRWITLTLTYRENTPAEYEPKYFKPNQNGDYSLSTKHLNLLVNIGSLKTSSLDMKVKFSGLDSLLFEDLCKIGIEETSIAAANKPSMLRGMDHSIASAAGCRTGGEEDGLVQTLGKLDMKNNITTTSPYTTQNSQDNFIQKDSFILDSVKNFILANDTFTAKICASKLKIKEEEVKKSFDILVKAPRTWLSKLASNDSCNLEYKQSSSHTGDCLDNNNSYDIEDEMNHTRSPMTCITNYSNSIPPHAPMKSSVKSYANRLNNSQLSDDIEDTYHDEDVYHGSSKKFKPKIIQNPSKQLQLPLKSMNSTISNKNTILTSTTNLQVNPLSNSELQLSMNNLKRDLNEIVSSQLSDYSDINTTNKKAKKCSIIREPIYLQKLPNP